MEIVKEFNEQYNFWVVKCTEGHKITTWNEGDDILKYGSFTIAYCPKDANLDAFRCVTDEEDARLLQLQKEAIEKEIEKEKENNKE